MPTEEEKKAIEAFLEEYGELVKKHEIDFVNYPMWQPDGQGGWKMLVQTTPVSTKNQPVKSFIQNS